MILRVAVRLSELLEHDVRRAVADLAAADVAVFNGDDGVVGALFGKLVDHDLAARAEVPRDPFCDLLQRVHFILAEHEGPPFLLAVAHKSVLPGFILSVS